MDPDSPKTSDPPKEEELLLLRRPGKGPAQTVTIVFVVLYLLCVFGASYAMALEIGDRWPLIAVAAAPAAFAVAVAIPELIRNPIPVSFILNLLLLPIAAAILFGGPCVLLAIRLSQLFAE
jgi:hypothetical protein